MIALLKGETNYKGRKKRVKKQEIGMRMGRLGERKERPSIKCRKWGEEKTNYGVYQKKQRVERRTG